MARKKTTEHSPMFEKIKNWYPKRWNKDRVHEAVVKECITAEEYKEITGEDYEA